MKNSIINKINNKLLYKINVSIFFTFFLISVVFVLIQIPFQNQRIRTAINNNSVLLQTLVERDKESLANEMFEKRTDAIKIRLNHMLSVKGIIGINVYDSHGKLLVAESVKEKLPVNMENHFKLDRKGIHLEQKIINGSPALDFLQEIKIIGENIGYIQIYFSLNEIEREKRTTIFFIFIMLLLILAVMLLLLNIIMAKTIINPINSLQTAMISMYDGDLGKKVKITTNDEIGFLASAFNSMSQKLAESYNHIKTQNAELDKMRSYLNNILESMPSVLITTDEAGIVTHWNRSASELTGIKDIDAMGKLIWSLLPEFENYREIVSEVLENGEKKELRREQVGLEKRNYYNISFFPLLSEGSSGIVIRIDDITEFEKKEAQLRQAQKMETVGTLAGGLAHDFNNVLGGIIGTISIFQTRLEMIDLPGKNQYMEYLKTMEISGERATNMVQQLLTLSRKKELALVSMDLNESVENVKKICENSIDKSVLISFQGYSGKALMKGDPTQVEQVLLNLCVNGVHAMTIMRDEHEKQGGVLTVEIKKIYADQYFVETHPGVHDKQYWMIMIKDTGVGMDKNTISKIFDPFFTTKEKGRGSGLGLSMVYNIIKQHDGFVDVYSEKGAGSSFNVYLPVSDDDESVINNAEIVLEKGAGLIFVVDDEEIIRKTAGEILGFCGYDVIYAANGEEAVEVFRERYQDVKGVLLDIAMPKKSGKECYIEMKKIDENVKVLIASGFKKDERVDAILRLGANDFIQKPYTLNVLSKMMASLLKHDS